MAAELNVLSQSISAYDLSPGGPGIVSSGLGAKGTQYSYKDWVNVNGVAIQSAGSYYRLLRLPVSAIINSLYFATSTALDSNATPTLAFALGLAFSDNPNDPGIRQDYVGNIPTTLNNGSVTTFAAFSSPNNLFGTIAAATLGHTGPFFSTNLIFNGAGANYPLTAISGNPLWNLFGFTDARGLPDAPGGMFDLYAYATAGAATGNSGQIWAMAEVNF